MLAYESYQEFQDSTDEIEGKIVLFMPAWSEYRMMTLYRRYAAREAAKRGAIAVLVRAVAPFSINSPHTGYQNYAEDVKKIPAATVTLEDAEMLLRMFRKGQEILVHLEMEDRNEESCESRNTIGELQGKEFKADENVIILSGHFDSWDVGGNKL